MSEFMGIIFGRAIAPDGTVRRRFRVKGSGEAYANLGNWLSTVKLSHEWDDFPWYGWDFENESDEEILRRVWGSYFIDDAADYYERAEFVPQSPERDEMADFFQQALSAAIQEEIDKEMIEKIKSVL